MNVVAFTGYSGAGKTTLLEGVIAALAARGLRVATVKHAHQGFDLDRPGKDSWRHRTAGAREVVVASDARVALLRELATPQPPVVADLLALLDPATDWVLVEGFRGGHLPKLEVWREAAAVDADGPAHPAAVAAAEPALQPAPTADPAHHARPPRRPHYPHDRDICAVVSDLPAHRLPVPTALPVLPLNTPPAVAQWLLDQAGRFSLA